jgi:hypothetical protein
LVDAPTGDGRWPEAGRYSRADGIAEPLKSQCLGHQLPGIQGVYAHVTEPMQQPLMARLQDRWLHNDAFW